jgi:insertion element IS1 protein InsB
MRPRVSGGVLGWSMGDILIDLPVEGHDAPHGAHGNLRVAEETPDAELPRIRMALLEVLDLQHEGQPDFPGGSLGGKALVHQPREVLRFKAVNPPIDGRAGDVDHHTGKVLAYVFGRRKDAVFLKLQQLLEPFGITKFYTDGWGAYERHIDTKKHHVGKENTQKIESKHINLRTRIKRLVRRTICFSKTEQMHDLVIGLFINRYEFGRAI